MTTKEREVQISGIEGDAKLRSRTAKLMQDQLERYRERDRDSKRHPKKYFAASRAQAGPAPRPARRARRT